MILYRYSISFSICFSLFFLTIPLFGQVKSFIRAGLNYSTVQAKDLNEISGTDIRNPLLHAHGGFSVEWFLKKKYSLLGGIHYSVKGYSDYNPQPSLLRPKDLKIQYISFPVTLNYSIYRNFQVGIGCEFDYQLVRFVPVVRQLEEDEHIGISKKHDFGGLLNIRYQVGSLEIGITAFSGFIKIIDINDKDVNRYYMNRNAQFYLAYFFTSD